MKSEKGEEGKQAKRSAARHTHSSKPTSIRGVAPGSASNFSIRPGDVSLTKMLEMLKPHDHLCLIYESQEEWRAVAVPFIAMGLRLGEKCMYIVDTSTAAEIRKYLAEEGVDVASSEKSGQLFILSETEGYTKEDSFDPDKKIALLISETVKAITEGYPALRTTGEMTWVLRGYPGSEKLLEYEAKLNRDFFPKYPCLAICQYDRWKFNPELIKGVIMTHPLLIKGNQVYHNFYYIPPEKFFNEKRAESEVQHWLNNLERENRREEELHDSEEKFSKAFHANPSPMCLTTWPGGLFTDVNEVFLRVTGYSREDIIGHTTAELGFWVEQDVRDRLTEMLLSRGRASNIECKFRIKSGEVRLGLDSVEIINVGGQQLLVSIINDITERKRVDEMLRVSEERYRLLAENVRDTIWAMDMNLQFTYVSPSVKYLGDRNAEEVMSMSLEQLLTPSSLELAMKVFADELALSKVMPQDLTRSRTLEVELFRRGGSILQAELKMGFMRDSNGRPVGILGVMRDISERKEAEEERRGFEQKTQIASRLASVGEMAAGIAHEINNPLTSVIGYSQLLSGREDIPADVKTDLKAIDEGAQRVAGIIKRLLTFARQSRPERTLVNINDLVINTLDLRAYHLRTNNIEVTTKLATDMPLTTADPAQLQQVFLNILVNADTAMTQAHGGGKLLIKTEEVNGAIRISFKDNGPGIAKKNLAKIFDPFFTTREVGQGTGLGLSICHGIVAEHKGKILAESKLGRGATFIVELPIVMGSRQLEMAEPSGKKLKKAPKAKILVVDDETSTLEFLSRLLTNEGHDVETVNNADEALEMVRNRRYSLILLDIKMPGTSGIELYGHMQKIALSLADRVIFITGDVMGTDTEAFLSKTKVPYITKPFDVNQLKKKIERFLTGD